MATTQKIGVILGSVVLVVGGLSVIFSHPKSDQLNAKKQIEAEISENLPYGSKSSTVLDYLDQKHIEHTYLPTQQTIVAIRRRTSTGFLVTGDVQIFFVFDKSGGLVSFRLQDVYTGL